MSTRAGSIRAARAGGNDSGEHRHDQHQHDDRSQRDRIACADFKQLALEQAAGQQRCEQPDNQAQMSPA